MSIARPFRKLAVLPLVALMIALMWQGPASAVFGVRLSPGGTVDQTGGSASGYDVQVDCPPGTAVVGMNGRWENYLTTLSLTCRTFAANGLYFDASGGHVAATAQLSQAGQFSGASNCPLGQVAVGLGSQLGDIIDGTRSTCQGFQDGVLTGSPQDGSLIGGSGGGYQQNLCPSAQVMTGLSVDTLSYDNQDAIAALQIRCSSTGNFGDFQVDLMLEGKGADTYAQSRGAKATKKIRPGKTATFQVDIQSDGDTADLFLLDASRSSKKFTISAQLDGVDVTGDLIAGTLTQAMAGGDSAPPLIVKVKVAKNAKSGQSFAVDVYGDSAGNPLADDSIYARVIVR